MARNRQPPSKNVSTPCDSYDNMRPLWRKCEAVCGGEEAVKAHDGVTLMHSGENFLIPFSPSMKPAQYLFLKREAELPGVSSEFAGLLVGALLRKEPEVVLPPSVPEEATNWITAEFGADGSPLVTYLDAMLWEEVENSRSWTFVDLIGGIPVPVLYRWEDVINWRMEGEILTMVIVKVKKQVATESEFHNDIEYEYKVHELVNGQYQVRTFSDTTNYPQVGPTVVPLQYSEAFTYIPAWPNNGEIEPETPFLLNLINKEIALYNKITRRNHLLYNASTYTPYMTGGVGEAEFQKIVGAGLGSWLNLPENAELKVLEVPTDALSDLEKSIATGFEEMAKLGARMMAPENTQSGVAMQLRNASQTARIGTLNTRVSVIMSQIIATMINWRYGLEIKSSEIKFNLQSDFTLKGQGADWVRIATEWYENNLIPRSVWLQLLRNNDMLPDDYNDDEATLEMEKEASSSFKTFSDDMNGDNPDEVDQ